MKRVNNCIQQMARSVAALAREIGLRNEPPRQTRRTQTNQPVANSSTLPGAGAGQPAGPYLGQGGFAPAAGSGSLPDGGNFTPAPVVILTWSLLLR